MKSVSQIRKLFIDFFVKKGHQYVESSSLVPNNDPTLLFTNAGMNQFKDVFLGLEKRDYKTAVTSQRCLRAGGKQNDLDNVGYTARHHTLFEMLGNFSFGQYFKEQAIVQAWELLTSSDYFALPPDRLYVTVYSEDEEAFNIWHKKVGLDPSRIIRIGDNKGARYESDNFWKMGDVGPCGPCSEIFYDHGEAVPGGLPGTANEDGDRYIEIWNLVFMQFNQLADGTMEKLKFPAVDTGMGIERLAAVLQHVNSNFEIDLFQYLITAIKKEINYQNDGSSSNSKSLRVIADHLRAITFMIADGIEPSNEKRGYVLRRILRRAIRHGYLLGKKDPFLHNLISVVVKEMDSAAEYIIPKLNYIKQVVLEEELQFSKTIESGMQLLKKELEQLDNKVLDGKIAFKLYDTYGFPLDLSEDICRELGYSIDVDGFDQEMARQRQRAKASNKFALDYNQILKVDSVTKFTGYQSTEDQAKIIALYQDGEAVEKINNHAEQAVIFVNQTPFYAESGGQVGDRGFIKIGNNIFIVEDTKKYGAAIAHHGKVLTGEFYLGQQINLEVDKLLRQKVAINHTATHLLRSALVEVLGTHVSQKGSLNSENLLRFDFNHKQALTAQELLAVEQAVNRQIRLNLPVYTKELPIEEAKKLGAEAVFDEKYGDLVRVVLIGDGSFSKEFCGGTHIGYTGEIGYCKIITDASISSGIRRIEALTGEVAIVYNHNQSEIIKSLISLTSAGQDKIIEHYVNLNEKTKALEKQLNQLEEQVARAKISQLTDKAINIGDVKILVQQVNVDKKVLKVIADDLRSRLGKSIVILANKEDGQYGLVATVEKTLTSIIGANQIIAELNDKLHGKGGGKAEIAMATTKDIGLVENALHEIISFIENKLK